MSGSVGPVAGGLSFEGFASAHSGAAVGSVALPVVDFGPARPHGCHGPDSCLCLALGRRPLVVTSGEEPSAVAMDFWERVDLHPGVAMATAGALALVLDNATATTSSVASFS